MSKELSIYYNGQNIPIQQFLDKLSYYFSLNSLDGKPERQKLRAEIKGMLEKVVVLDIEKPEPF